MSQRSCRIGHQVRREVPYQLFFVDADQTITTVLGERLHFINNKRTRMRVTLFITGHTVAFFRDAHGTLTSGR